MRMSASEAGGALRKEGAALLMGWLGGVVDGAEAGDAGGFTRGPYLQGANVRGVSPHEADRKCRYFPLGSAKRLLRPGVNVIAIEAHNDDLGSSDLTMDPYLIFDLDAAGEVKPGGEGP